MAVWNIGSVTTHVGNVIGWSNITSISGTTLNNIAIQELNFMNTFTNDNVSQNNILEKYQPSLIDLTMSRVLLSIEASEGGVDSVKLGDLSISQGKGGSLEIANSLRETAIQKLKELGRSVRFTRVIAGA